MRLSKILDKLYEYDLARAVKEYLRPIKHFIFGKSDIYFVIDEIKKARGNEEPVKIVLDIGAAVGDKTITFLKSFPEATVYCFEPQPKRLEQLKERTALYKDRLKTFDFGFLNKNDKVFLDITSHRDTSSILPIQKYIKDKGIKEIGRKEIQVRRLDDFAKEQKIEHIDFVKIDVEGVEKEVLEGGKEVFQNKIENVFIEISSLRKGPRSQDYIDIFRFLHKRGFTFIGCYEDYFFSKDKHVLRKYFGQS